MLFTILEVYLFLGFSMLVASILDLVTAYRSVKLIAAENNVPASPLLLRTIVVLAATYIFAWPMILYDAFKTRNEP